PFKPINFDKLPPVFRDADARWFTVHSLNIAFLVNRKLVKEVPRRWADLLKPEYRNAVVYLDPRSTGQGQVDVFAAAYAMGGSVDDPKPGADFFGKLKNAGNVLRVEGTTPYAKFVMSDAGQALFAQGYVRPAVPGVTLAPEVAAKMPNAPQVHPLDAEPDAGQRIAEDHAEDR
ncbi:ABC transporter substrate-binding protein, partial [Burkholderia anthina]|uniref:ABC transporter substrate-binding protein n=1 Tax=Burkholderia anthina TaxID=179879 RepID=UPI001588C936